MLCECGCGRPAPISSYTSTARGYRKGEPRRFIHGHNRPVVERRKASERFWEKVQRGGSGECWLWTGASRGIGHGVFWYQGKNVVSSRFSYELMHGPIANDVLVLHRCDIPACVNPAHLFTGDQAANLRDMVEKGRSLTGSRHNMAKLTEDAVVTMRARATGRRGEATEFAREYGVTVANICMILARKTWRHVA